MTVERCTLCRQPGLVKRPLVGARTIDGIHFFAHKDCLSVRAKRLKPGFEDTIERGEWGR